MQLEHPMLRATLRPGYAVALLLEPETSPLRCYVGQVQDVDEYGLRISTLIWDLEEEDERGEFIGFDIFVPWANIQSALVATPGHNIEEWKKKARVWQDWANELDEEEFLL